MRIDVLTLFPEVFTPMVSSSIIGRACSSGLVKIQLTNFRDFSTDVHRSVDDAPYGGGPGMVLRCEPIFLAIEHLEGQSEVPIKKVLLTPQGQRLTQSKVKALATEQRILMLCGHYEGFDERIRQGIRFEEISIGDYVLSGGEPAAMVLIDALVRLQNGALGDARSACEESFENGLLEYPHYTRPREFRGMTVPDVLLSGHHEQIRQWRQEQSLHRTQALRPDLLNKRS